MPLRFYRRFRTGPFRINLGKRGASFSVGRRGAWLTLGHGRVRETVGLPGTGLSYYEQQRLRGRATTLHALNWALLAFVLLAVIMLVGR